MANYGKRMVSEVDIAQIGQGGGAEYTAGDNITIEDGVISATDTTYTAGDGISITNNAISVDSTVALTSNLATVATTGAYSDLTGTPTIPAAVSGTNDGTNWTTLTIGSTTKNIPSGGGSSETVIEISANISTTASTSVTLSAAQLASYKTAVLANEPVTFVLLLTGAPGAANTRVYLRPGQYIYTGLPDVNNDTAFYGFYNNNVVRLRYINDSTGTGYITTAALTFTTD